MYKIIIEEDLEKTFFKLSKKDKTKYEYLKKKVKQLSENPYSGKPLKNVLKGKWRVHLGEFILIYTVNEQEKSITFLKFAHHDETYR